MEEQSYCQSLFSFSRYPWPTEASEVRFSLVVVGLVYLLLLPLLQIHIVFSFDNSRISARSRSV